jgi:hypothetical protein
MAKLIILGLLTVGFLVAWWTDPGHEAVKAAAIQPEAIQKAKTPAVLADCSKQDDRNKLISKLLQADIFYKLEQPASLPHLYVGRRFDGLSIDEKQAFIGAVFAYYWCLNGSQIVVLRESRKGHEIGTFNSLRGLSLE